MNKSTLLHMAIVLLGGCSQMSSTSSPEANGNESNGGVESLANQSSPRGPEKGNFTSPSQSTALRMGDYLCAPSLTNDCDEGSPLVATSEAEAGWLAAHGYPTRQALDGYSSISTLALEARASKSQLDSLVLAERYIKDARRNKALEQAFPVVQGGNVYGLYVMHDIMAAPGRGFNRIDSGAYLKMAFILGDYKAALQFNELYGGLTAPEILKMEERASLLIEQFRLARTSSRPMN